MKINTLDDCEGQAVAVSDSGQSHDDDLCEKLHEFWIMIYCVYCRKLRSGRKPKCYVQCQNEGVYTVNCELYILDKRNA